MSALPEHPWGRVEEDGTVYVVEDGVERQVGQYPDGTPEEALAYFVRKFSDLEGQVSVLEQRVRNGAPASDVARSVAHLEQQLQGANVVGDLASLRTRLGALGGSVSELTEQQQQESRAQLAEAIATREAIVVEAERLAAQDPASVQWKQTSAAMDDLFAQWQSHQQTGPRLPKSDANALWKRFRQARNTIDSERRAFFAELDATHKQARDAKNRIIERAEELAPRGADGVAEYRRLLDEWKAAGRAGRKYDDALWARFKAAGDVLFQAKGEIDLRESEELSGNLEAKEALLEEAQPILKITDRRTAREKLGDIQRRWDEIGRVPRDRFKAVEDRLRQVEQHVRKLDDDHWSSSDPEKKARSEGMHAQLHEAIAKLEAERDAAAARGDAAAEREAEDALAARRSWLAALGG
ncbi:DUF349 domain-containing protein [Pseudoclavibacter chungangensis]|uniref:DUF349 domain-containing protein n=1 Tax=Pseudoclavibacter chungangensis TaxID=587635 RepID=A0A7J5BWL1_9MICO|nr:DUF349 domain-containing protein [Pseudoclavibacter chungangensis]KAB1657869.1 DUF349 domain-containing protein [Pseudoclavibacter chungangensis]NYJ66529.1 peptidoglycan hydrolase CwlO-like protein [Pseudoclavibacter chungangensis]